MRIYKIWTGLLLVMVFGFLPAQTGFSAERLGKEINSEYDELMPRFSPDGGRMYFVRYQHPENVGGRKAGQDIWFSELGPEGNWSTAVNMGSPLNNPLHNAVGGVGYLGKTIFLANLYPEAEFKGSPGISVAEFQNGAWSTPQAVFEQAFIDTLGQFLDFFVTSDQQIMVMSMGKGKQSDIYYALNEGGGHFSAPKPLGKNINSEKFSEMTPYITQDGRKLIFTSTSTGQGDIFFSERVDEGWENWTEPKSLGPKVNSPGLDAHFVIDPAGKNGYFMSGITPTSPGDLYRIGLDELELWEDVTIDTISVTLLGDEVKTLDLSAYLKDASQLPFVQPMLKSTQVFWTRHPRTQEWQMTSSAPNFPGYEYQEFWICESDENQPCRTVAVEVRTLPEATAGLTEEKSPDTRSDAAIFEPEDISSVEIVIEEPKEPLEPIEEPRLIEPVVQVVPLETVVEVQPIEPIVQIDPVETVEPIEAEVPVESVEELPKSVWISGFVKDEQSGAPLEAELSFFKEGKEMGKVTSDPVTGAYRFELKEAQDLDVDVQRQYYFPKSQHMVMGKAALKGQLNANFDLSPMPLEEGQTFVLKNIYFDLDKAILKPESKAELLRLHDLLKANPSMEIEVRGHTDSQADDEYNQTLSEARAAAVMNYLKYQGIMGYRLSSAGFGEKQPIATNETEEGRALNRRVEFLIKKN